MGCSECEGLMQAKQDLEAERDELLVICEVLMKVITVEQFAEARRLAAARDAVLPEASP